MLRAGNKRARVAPALKAAGKKTRTSDSLNLISSIATELPGAQIVLHQYEALATGSLTARYKRFLGDVLIGSDVDSTVVHVPNTGPMTGLLDTLPAPALLSKSSSATRKYAHTLEWMRPDFTSPWVGVHSAKANAMVRALLESGVLNEMLPHDSLRAEVRLSKESRVDFVLAQKDGTDCFLEVKSVTLAEVTPEGKTMALFPDTVSLRAQKHVAELTAIAKAGGSAALLFLVQRSDCEAFAPCHEKDPVYGKLVIEAAAAGVTIVAVDVELDHVLGRVIYRGVLPFMPEYKLLAA